MRTSKTKCCPLNIRSPEDFFGGREQISSAIMLITRSLHKGCNGLQRLAEIIILDSNGFGAKVVMIAARAPDRNECVVFFHLRKGGVRREK